MTERIVMSRGIVEVSAALDELLPEDIEPLRQLATPEKIAELRDQHLAMYRKRIAWGRPPVNVEECQRLLSVWESMEGQTFLELSPEAQLEVLDALAAGP